MRRAVLVLAVLAAAVAAAAAAECSGRFCCGSCPYDDCQSCQHGGDPPRTPGCAGDNCCPSCPFDNCSACQGGGRGAPPSGSCDSCPYGACQACGVRHIAKMAVSSAAHYCPDCPGKSCGACEVKHVAAMLNSVPDVCPGCLGNACGQCTSLDVEKLMATTNHTAPLSAATPGEAYKHITVHNADKRSALCDGHDLEKCTFMDVARAVPEAAAWRTSRGGACPSDCKDCRCSVPQLAKIVMALPGYCPGCMTASCELCTAGDIAQHMANSAGM